MKEKEEPLPEQWEGRLQAGKGICGLRQDEGSWEVAALHVLSLFVCLLREQNCRSFLVCFIKVLLQHFILLPYSVGSVS